MPKPPPLLPSLLLLALGANVLAAEPSATSLRNGKEINELCAGCHGEFGQGGKDGEYPRLAGLPAPYLVRQLELFRERARPNMAMTEYVDHRQMPDADIADVSAYLASIQLRTRLPEMNMEAPDFDAHARLLQAKQVIQIPPAPGDPGRGERQYRKECGSCHGRQGEGDPGNATPPLAGQYTRYLWRQVERFLARQRIHDPDDPEQELLAAFSREELQDIFAHLARLDD